MRAKLGFHLAQHSRTFPTSSNGNFRLELQALASDHSDVVAGLRKRVAARLEELGKKPVPTATEAGLGRDFITDILNGKKQSVRGDKVAALAGALEMTPEQLLHGKLGEVAESLTVPLVGYVGAGDAAHNYDEGDFGSVSAPDNATPTTVARLVRGQSIGRYFDGWLVFNDEPRDGVDRDLLGQLCVVGLADRRTLVKWLQPSSLPNRYHLYSQTEDPILDQEVLWSARVTNMRPR